MFPPPSAMLFLKGYLGALRQKIYCNEGPNFLLCPSAGFRAGKYSKTDASLLRSWGFWAWSWAWSVQPWTLPSNCCCLSPSWPLWAYGWQCACSRSWHQKPYRWSYRWGTGGRGGRGGRFAFCQYLLATFVFLWLFPGILSSSKLDWKTCFKKGHLGTDIQVHEFGQSLGLSSSICER